MNVDKVKQEFGAFYRKHQQEITALFYSSEDELSPHCKVATKIKGRLPSITAVIDHVIQGFTNTWTPMGKAHFKPLELQNYRLKINFPFDPEEIEHTYLAWANENDRDPLDRTISRFVMEELLKPAMIDDINELSITGSYDANDLQSWGKAMNGLIQIITQLLANSTRPCYRIPLTAITDVNILDQINSFERKIPQKIKKKIKKIFLSQNNLERYINEYENVHGTATLTTLVDNVKNTDGVVKIKTKLGKRELVGLSNLPDNIIFATVDGNLIKIIDLFDKPAQDREPQYSDYLIKLFFAFWLGYGFAVPEMVFVANFTDAKEGYPAALFAGANALPKLFPDQKEWS